MARLSHRAAEDYRSTYRSYRTWRERIGRLPSGDSVATGVRVFSKAHHSGWGPERTASAWVVLMKRLGYAQFVAQGGDLGAGVCTVMAKHAPPELLGIHTNFPGTIPSDIARALQCGDPPPSGLSADEKRAYEQLTNLFAKKRAYAQMMATRPQTLYGLADSPVCLAAWLFDHGDGYGQPAAPITSAVLGRAINGHSAGNLTRDDVLDDFTLYWLTNTAIFRGSFLLGTSPQSL